MDFYTGILIQHTFPFNEYNLYSTILLLNTIVERFTINKNKKLASGK